MHDESGNVFITDCGERPGHAREELVTKVSEGWDAFQRDRANLIEHAPEALWCVRPLPRGQQRPRAPIVLTDCLAEGLIRLGLEADHDPPR